MEKLRAGVDFIISSYKRTAAALFIVAIVLSIPFTLTLVGQQQDLRQRADEGDTITNVGEYVGEEGVIWDYNVDPVPEEIQDQCWTNGTCFDFVPPETTFFESSVDDNVIIPYVTVPPEEEISPQEVTQPVYEGSDYTALDDGQYYCQQQPATCFLGGLWQDCQEPYAGWCSNEPAPTPIPCTPLPEQCISPEGNIICYFFAYPPGGWCPIEPDTVFCTQEVRVCADGTYVSRTGPNCEFSPCPDVLMSPTPTPLPPGVCASDIRICDNGSAVGRTGPNCEFTSCPSEPTPTPELTTDTFDSNACQCNGMEYINLTPGQEATITAFSKVTAQNPSTAVVVNTQFSLYDGIDENVATRIIGPVTVPATAVSEFEYKSEWKFILPQLETGHTYRIAAEVDGSGSCRQVTALGSSAGSNVLGVKVYAQTPSQVEVLEKTCSFIIFRLASAETCEKNRGDANCDGSTDTDDFNAWRDEFLSALAQTLSSVNPRADFNNDGTVNTDDFNLWRDRFLNLLN
jgi:hypothetical protein